MTQVVRLLLALLVLGVGTNTQPAKSGTPPDASHLVAAVAADEHADSLASAPRPGLDDVSAAALPANRPLRLAYYFPQDSTSLDSLRTNIRHLDIVAPHWLEIDADGDVTTIPSSAGQAYLHTAGVMVLPSVALKGRGAGHAIVTNPDVMTNALQQLLDAVDPWDGLALDFEGLDGDDRSYLTAFINVLSNALHERGKFYAIALPAKTSDATTGWGGAYDYDGIAQAADLYLVMAYGYRTGSSATPGSSAPLPWMDEAIAYAVKEIPPDKLVLGVPFYGYDWNVTQGPPARALRYRDTRELLESTGATSVIDRASGSAMFEYTDDSGNRHEVWYEDERSLAPKLNLVRKYHLRGIGAWRLGQEDPRAWTVWEQVLTSPTFASENP